ncbi:MAG: C69 family dipeptidase, partial [Schwartzia sp.]|nr:C69 family dipeptidase [Schwartzia sp. (in: firmicutes)]
DGDFFIAANQLRIHAIREGDPNQMFNPKLPETLKELGWAEYGEDGNLDWVRSLKATEFHHPYYSKRRVWRAMSLVAPSKNLPPRVESWDSKAYPLTIKPDRKLNVEDVARMYRDYYQGTEFDKSKSPLAGMYGSPYHYEIEMGERSILSSKTSYSHITQASDALPSPVVWMSTDTAYENPFIPFAVAKMPEEYRALRNTYDPTKMFWASNAVMALNQAYFNIMSPLVKDAVEKLEANSMQLINASAGLSKEKFAEVLRNNALKNINDWKQLSVELLKQFRSDVGIKYERQPRPDTPTEY